VTLSYGVARASSGRQRRSSRFVAALMSESRQSTSDPRSRARRGRLVAPSCRVCGATLTEAAARKLGRCLTCPSTMDEELYGRLREWRLAVATAQQVPAYVVFTDATLMAVAERRPGSPGELTDIAGIGPRKLSLYGEAVLALVRGETFTTSS
jgi:ATP-dependent DNA helicase UvrD/PcrA